MDEREREWRVALKTTEASMHELQVRVRATFLARFLVFVVGIDGLWDWPFTVLQSWSIS